MTIDRRKLIQLGAAAAASAPLFAPHVARAATKKLRMGHNNSPTSALQVSGVVFGKYLAEKTEGRYELDIYPSAQLGSDVQLVKAVSDGTLDMTVSGTALFGAYHKDVELIEMPYLFGSLGAGRKALDGALGAYCAEALQKSGFAVIGWGENGMRHITANKPIRTVADLKGLKIRVQPAKIHVESFNGLGAAAAPLNFNELAEALRTGRFEAQENPLSVITSNEFIYKGQSHLSLTGHVYSPFVATFSNDVLEEMTPADRAIVRDGGKLAAQATRDFADKAVANGLDQLKAAGMTIVTDVDVPAFQKAMEGMSDKLASIVGADAITRVRGLIA